VAAYSHSIAHLCQGASTCFRSLITEAVAKLLHTSSVLIVATSCSMLQGVLAPADAQLAVRAGVDGIILRCTQHKQSLQNASSALCWRVYCLQPTCHTCNLPAPREAHQAVTEFLVTTATMAGGSATACRQRSSCCRTSSMPSAMSCRSSWTAASDEAPTC
jgi:hypothetical protein